MFYISVTQGDGMGGDFLAEARPVTGELISGTAMIPWHKGSRDNDVGNALFRHVLGLSQEDVEASWSNGSWWHTLHVLELNEDGWYEKDQVLPVHYVWWVGDGRMAVATTRSIFIMGEGGQTIARVR